MKIVEVEQKYFFANEGTFELLESYLNPDLDLQITFEESKQNPEVHYGYVNERKTGNNVITIVFTLNKNGVIDIGNIIPNSELGHHKKVYTSQGEQDNGVDIGVKGIRWVKEKIKDYALSKGYDLQKMTTSTRYTGTRAKNNPNDILDKDTVKHFDIDRPFRESVTLDFQTGKLTRYKGQNE